MINQYIGKNLPYCYDRYPVDVEKSRQRPQQPEQSGNGCLQEDTADISEAGKNALKNKMSAWDRGTVEKAGKLLSVSSMGYLNDFEKIVSELSSGTVTNTFVTGNYSQERVNDLQPKFEVNGETKRDCFDCHVNKMVSAYNRMNSMIDEKYANPDREQEYYIADDGTIQELTKEKEQEMLDKAYQ